MSEATFFDHLRPDAIKALKQSHLLDDHTIEDLQPPVIPEPPVLPDDNGKSKGKERVQKRDSAMRQQERIYVGSSDYSNWDRQASRKPPEATDMEESGLRVVTFREPLEKETAEIQQRWGKWLDHDRMDDPRNIAYAFNRSFVTKAFAFSAEEEQAVKQRYAAYYERFDQPSPNDNAQPMVIAHAIHQSYMNTLDAVHESPYPTHVSYKIGTRFLAHFLEDIAGTLDAALTQQTEDIPLILIPPILELAKSSSQEVLQALQQYPKFMREKNQDDVDLKNAMKALDAVQIKLQSPESLHPVKAEERKSINGDHAGWFFFHATNLFTTEELDIIGVSHTPHLPLVDYYQDGAAVGGVFLYGKAKQAFSADASSDAEWLRIAYEDRFTLEEYIKGFDLNGIRKQAQEYGISIEEQEALLANKYRSIYCTTLQEAWEKRHNFTEIWLADPDPIAIWFDIRDGENIYFHHKPFALLLLASRPDLPVVDLHGHPLERSEVIHMVNKWIFRRNVFKDSPQPSMPEVTTLGYEDTSKGFMGTYDALPYHESLNMVHNILEDDIPSVSLFNEYRPNPEWFANQFSLKGDHTIAHETRVMVLQELLARMVKKNGISVDQEALRWASALHDTQRQDDWNDYEHGNRAAQWISENVSRLEIPEGSVQKVQQICRNHVPSDSSILQYMDPETAIFKDADGLDRVRLGDLDPRYLRTEEAQRIFVSLAKKLYEKSSECIRNGIDPFEAVMQAGMDMGIIIR